jgi:hypothetical protein
MDRITAAANRLWGSLGKDGQLHGSPRFADELAAQYNGNLAVLDTRVSKWSYGHQLEHLYRTSHYVLDRLEESMTGLNATKHMGPWGCGLMVGGFIPRYWFPTIPQLVPLSGSPEDIEPLKDDLKRRLEQVEWRLSEIKENRGKSRHPRLKYLSSSQWLFFQDVHHRHHLGIMRDILKAAG